MKLNIKNSTNYITESTITVFEKNANKANVALHNKTGKGSDFLGWVNLPNEISNTLLSDIETTAKVLQNKIDIMVTIGIGGSYLGSKAIIEALSDNFSTMKNEPSKPKMVFAGQNLSEDYLYELRDLLKDKSYALTIISKSGTTTEPAVAFRILKKDLEEKYGKEEATSRIIAITDKEKGALKQLANQEGYKTYDIPDDVGGRFSVLTPVGLFPIAVAGYNIKQLIEGAKSMIQQTSKPHNIAETYAAVRNILYSRNYTNEILVNYNPKLTFLAEWWKQLYGESEGKEGKGIFPASVSFTTDLHSMGQYIQDGKRNIFETVISVERTSHPRIALEKDEANLDKLNYLAGKNIEDINRSAQKGTAMAHIDGKVPIINITIPELNEFHLGELIYFFEKACGISGYILNVNPFDQPGVEAYKKNMFEILGKPVS